MPEGWLRGPGARQFSLKERLEEKAFWSGECWLWRKAGTNGRGYLWKDGRPEVAARISYEVFIGPVSRADEVKIICGNAACIAPAHLEKQKLKTSLRKGGVVGQKWRQRPTDIAWEVRLTESYAERKKKRYDEEIRLANLEWADIILKANLIGPSATIQQVALGTSHHSGGARKGHVRRGPPHGGRWPVKTRPSRTYLAPGHRKARA